MSKIINNPDEIDLDRSGVIEASAGTGKTYTIQNMVARIIRLGKCSYKNIVVVTYTEKAAGELKTKIQKQLAEVIADKTNNFTPDMIDNCREALSNYGGMTISTIHGFCSRILHNFSFENGESFNLSSSDFNEHSDQIKGDLFRRGIYTDFERMFSDDYENVIKEIFMLTGWTETPEDFISIPMSLAQKINFKYDEVIPETGDVSGSLKDQINSVFDEIEVLITEIKSGLNGADWGERIKSSKNGKFRRIVTILLRLKNLDNNEIKGNILSIKKDLQTEKVEDLQKYLLKNKLFSGDGGESGTKIIEDIERLIDTALRLRGVLLVYLARKYKEIYENYKSEKAVITFDDMISKVEAQVTGGNGDKIKSILRREYKYCIVDEFQDTDILQWNIFKGVFLNNDSKLFIIGDPKQSIYRFRNADVDTYLAAKREIIAGGGACYTLNTNYRSVGRVIREYNMFFGSSHWFGRAGENGEIAYSDVNEAKTPRCELAAGQNGGLVPVKLLYSGASKKYKNQYADYICAEISRLLSEPYRFRKDGIEKNISPSDIAILTDTKKTAGLIRRVLSKKNIKSTLYKSPGLYDCDEMHNIRIIINAFTLPEIRFGIAEVMLTDFFGYRYEDLHDLSDSVIESVMEIAAEWKSAAAERSWIRLFEMMVRDTSLFERILSGEETLNAERKIANYRHIIELITDRAVSKNLDIYGVLYYIDNLMELSGTQDNSQNLLRIDSDERKINIMTMHTSKGLEFPIVFVFSDKYDFKDKSNPFCKFHNKNNRICYDIMKDKGSAEKEEAEYLAEHKRLFYVALTRGALLTYLPVYYSEKKSKDGTPSVLTPHNYLERSTEEFKEIIKVIEPQPENGNRDTDIETGGLNKNRLAEEIISPIKIEDEFAIRTKISQKDVKITSYTGLKKRLISINDEKVFDEESYPADKDIKNNLILPGGRNSGIIVHSILELSDFTQPSSAPHNTHVIENAIKTGFYGKQDEYTGSFKTLFDNLRSVDFNHDRGSFKLMDIDINKQLKEVRFTMTADSPDDIMITGSMDYVFYLDGRYYLADWKTDTLQSYSPEAVKNSVIKDYSIQKIIYKEALSRWIGSVKSDYNYGSDFGGIFYIFLRGIDSDGNGVYFERGDLHSHEKEYKTLQSEVIKNAK